MKILIILLFIAVFSYSSLAYKQFYPESRNLTVHTVKTIDELGENELSTYSYDKNGNITQIYTEYLRNENKKRLITNTYYDDGRLKSEKWQHNTDGIWSIGAPVLFKYWQDGDSSYLEKSNTVWDYKDSSWHTERKEICIFDEMDSILSKTSMTFDKDKWKNSGRDLYYRDKNNNCTLMVHELWYPGNDEWGVNYKQEFTYNDRNQMTSYSLLRLKDYVWEKGTRDVVEYYDDGEVKTWAKYIANELGWVLDYKLVYNYDENSLPTVVTLEGGEYVGYTDYKYSELGQLIKIITRNDTYDIVATYEYTYNVNLNLSEISFHWEQPIMHTFFDSRGRRFSFSGFTVLINEGIVSVEDEPKTVENEIVLYPNPCSSTLNVNLSESNSNPEQIAIVDLCGRTLKVQKKSNGQQTLSVVTDDLPPGIYFLEIYSKGNPITKKFIKQE
jgi:hypothetical protein